MIDSSDSQPDRGLDVRGTVRTVSPTNPASYAQSYLARYRAAHPDYVAKERARNAALRRAQRRVANNHPAELAEALAEELRQ